MLMLFRGKQHRRAFSSAGKAVPLRLQKYLVSILLKIFSQILQNLVKKMKSQILIVIFFLVENGHFSHAGMKEEGSWFD